MMLDENPYRPVLLSEKVEARTHLTTAIWWMVYLHPVLALGLVYACWALTTIALGRPPRFGEHPDNELAHSVVHALGYSAMLLILGTPLLVPIAITWGPSQPFGASRPAESSIRARAACLLIYVILLVTVAWVSYSDPFRVMYWFLD